MSNKIPNYIIFLYDTYVGISLTSKKSTIQSEKIYCNQSIFNNHIQQNTKIPSII